MVYNETGWPVDPRDRCQKVRILSANTELWVNSIFFFVFPIKMMYEAWLEATQTCSCDKNETNKKAASYGLNTEIDPVCI